MKKEQLKKLLVLSPVLLIPLTVLAVWFFNRKDKQTVVPAKGLNTVMPTAVLKDEKGMDKLSFYDEIAKDSLKQKEQERNDPFFLKKPADTIPSLANLRQYTDPNEAKVYAKLAELNKVIRQQPAQPSAMPEPAYTNNADVDRLEKMLQNVQQKDDGDTELAQLNKMMDKLMLLQHPDTQKINKPVSAPVQQITTVVLKQTNGFYASSITADTAYNTIRASVAETQTLVNGSTIKLIIEDAIVLKNKTVPANSFVYGTAALNNERLKISINAIRVGNSIVPVALEAYDLDGMAGIYVPGSISRDVAKQSAGESVNGIGLATLDPSIGAQAASAGILAAKSLIGKKVKLVKVTVRAGYQVLLQQNN